MTRSQRIPMKSIRALTLQKGKMTAARRTSAVPQLTCEGKACRIYQPDVVQCTAVGDDGAGGLEWSCTAELPKGVRFGAVEVSCEGWHDSSDPYILRGSCGLTYNLVRTHSALEDGTDSYLPRFSSTQAPHPLVSLGILALSIYAIWSFIKSCLLPRRRAVSDWFRSPGGGGGGWGGWGGGGGGGPGFGGGRGPPPPYSSKPPETAGWRPGFWTGALAGALGTQAARGLQNRGGYANAQEERFRARQTGWGVRDDWDRGTGWGRGGGSGGLGASGSGEMRRSTGFGGTRNR